MLGLAIQLFLAGISALPASSDGTMRICIGNVETLHITRAEERRWPFVPAAGTLSCEVTDRGRIVRFTPQGAFGDRAELADNPYRRVLVLLRHPHMFDRSLDAQELANGIHWMAQIGDGLCQRRRAVKIRRCFK